MDSKSNKILKRERGPNWEEDEKTIFFHCYENVAKVLEDPKKDFNTNSKKNQTWLCLMNKFNAHSNVKKREIKNLKKFWESEKTKSRKAFTMERNARLGTGGGYNAYTHLF
ncbi:uncharacterized protein LOC132925153 [Rhopalosiphum padi]|uniref:uncharacterized protein LOC132925153 n=1 Tax=Rhopalosiphum padi TaxID=40932 RepID=UPI00298DC712|nr:uncharacterized protein LOC132925153 [Rhopalosiphum padi]